MTVFEMFLSIWNEVKKKAIDTVVGLVAGALATGLIYMIAQNM